MADGQSVCAIAIEKMNLEEKGLSTKKHTDKVFLRTTGGLIMVGDVNNRPRSINLVSGKAAFRLVSDNAPRVVTITAFSKDTKMLSAEPQIELV